MAKLKSTVRICRESWNTPGLESLRDAKRRTSITTLGDRILDGTLTCVYLPDKQRIWLRAREVDELIERISSPSQRIH